MSKVINGFVSLYDGKERLDRKYYGSVNDRKEIYKQWQNKYGCSKRLAIVIHVTESTPTLAEQKSMYILDQYNPPPVERKQTVFLINALT